MGAAYVAHKDLVSELTITVARGAIVEACRIARDAFGYQQLMEIAAADYPERPERFEVNYHLLSLTENHRIRLKLSTDEETPVPSVTSLWPVAGWLEREVFDMYGVTFAGNADLRRILTDYGFEGHPLRKDFPQTGFVELRYSEDEKRVVYEPVSLPQDFRTFDFLMPWEGPEYRLPGDEKAEGQASGAPSPAAAPSGPPRVEAKAGPGDPKTTEKPSDTGAGAPTDAAAKKQARKPAAKKRDNAGGRTIDQPEPKPGDKP
ncbi:MAG: NADH-quinone oxidoreductase subunit C [Pseudomonadota bacterium]|nr:NADH-quinone oxidoreductase subunit C [Pseudomonadota bacterium]